MSRRSSPRWNVLIASHISAENTSRTCARLRASGARSSGPRSGARGRASAGAQHRVARRRLLGGSPRRSSAGGPTRAGRRPGRPAGPAGRRGRRRRACARCARRARAGGRSSTARARSGRARQAEARCCCCCCRWLDQPPPWLSPASAAATRRPPGSPRARSRRPPARPTCPWSRRPATSSRSSSPRAGRRASGRRGRSGSRPRTPRTGAGRRGAARACRPRPRVGTVESRTRSWAIQRSGSRRTSSIWRSICSSFADGPMNTPLPPDSLVGLTTISPSRPSTHSRCSPSDIR